MNPLKPCPFCLTDGDERLIELWDTFDAGHIAHVHCTHCGADGPSVYGEMGAAPTIARARSMWNGRAEYLKTPNDCPRALDVERAGRVPEDAQRKAKRRGAVRRSVRLSDLLCGW